MRRKWMVIVPAALAGMLLFAFIGGEIVKQLWNGLLPPLFGWRQVTFRQALGLLVLCRILFGGHGFSGARSSGRSPEERERIRRRLRERFPWLRAQPRDDIPPDGGSHVQL